MTMRCDENEGDGESHIYTIDQFHNFRFYNLSRLNTNRKSKIKNEKKKGTITALTVSVPDCVRHRRGRIRANDDGLAFAV